MEYWYMFFAIVAFVLCFVVFFAMNWQLKSIEKDYMQLADKTIEQNEEIYRLNGKILDLETEKFHLQRKIISQYLNDSEHG